MLFVAKASKRCWKENNMKQMPLECQRTSTNVGIDCKSLRAMNDDKSLNDESSTTLTTGILNELNEEHARCQPNGRVQNHFLSPLLFLYS
jgi:hypothetical protein